MAKLTLNQIASTIKSERTLIILIIVSTALLALAVTSYLKRSKTDQSTQAAFNQSIYPGRTKKNQLEKNLGSPIKTESKDNSDIYYYPTESKYRPTQVELTDDTVSLVKEQITANERGILQDYLQKYGQPDAILYGQFGTIAPGHFWQKHGILVFGSKLDNTINEIWYFKPTSLQLFLNQNRQLSQQEPKRF